MNMFRAFMELDEAYNDRQYFIDELKKAGKNYNFSRYTDAQLYRMYQRLQKPISVAKEPKHELDLDFDLDRDFSYCECGARLSDAGFCPICYDGEEDLTEAGNAKSRFAANIDTNILELIDSTIPEEPIKDTRDKCSKTVVGNALCCIKQGKATKFCLGTIGPTSSKIAHCWVESDGEIIQTNNPFYKVPLITKFSVDLVPNDVEASKKLIVDLINGINNGSITEGLLDMPSMSNFVTASGKPVNIKKITSASKPTMQQAQAQTTPTPHLPSGRYAVRIVSDHGRLRALGTDGVHPAAWVVFPNNLRKFDGQLYEVDQLIWNGKNYRVAGNIVEI